MFPKEISGYDHDKYYIGITCQKLNDRWGKNGYGYREQPFYKAIQKYGWNNMRHEILFRDLSYEEACEMEIDLIAQ